MPLDPLDLELVKVEAAATVLHGATAWPCPTCGRRRLLADSHTVVVRNRTGQPLERRIRVCDDCLAQLRWAGQAAPDDDIELRDAAVLRDLLEDLGAALESEVAFVSCIRGRRFVIAQARDPQGMGFETGAELDLADTFCVRHLGGAGPHRTPDATQDPAYRDAPARERYGIRSYGIAPIVLPDGTVWGTLCALDRVPHRVSERDVALLRAGAAMVATWLQERRERLEAVRSSFRAQRLLAALQERLRRASEELDQHRVLLGLAVEGGDQPLDGDVTEAVRGSLEELRSLGVLLEADPDADLDTSAPTLVEVAALVRSTVDLAAAMAPQAAFEVTDGESAVVNIPPVGLRQALLALLLTLASAGAGTQVAVAFTASGRRVEVKASGTWDRGVAAENMTGFVEACRLAEQLGGRVVEEAPGWVLQVPVAAIPVRDAEGGVRGRSPTDA